MCLFCHITATWSSASPDKLTDYTGMGRTRFYQNDIQPGKLFFSSLQEIYIMIHRKSEIRGKKCHPPRRRHHPPPIFWKNSRTGINYLPLQTVYKTQQRAGNYLVLSTMYLRNSNASAVAKNLPTSNKQNRANVVCAGGTVRITCNHQTRTAGVTPYLQLHDLYYILTMTMCTKSVRVYFKAEPASNRYPHQGLYIDHHFCPGNQSVSCRAWDWEYPALKWEIDGIKKKSAQKKKRQTVHKTSHVWHTGYKPDQKSTNNQLKNATPMQKTPPH